MTTEKAAVKAAVKPTFKVKRRVNIPLLKAVLDEAINVKILTPVYQGKDMPAAPGKKKMEPAHLAKCVNLENGELVEIIVNAVLQSIFDEEYPGHSYVDMYFQIIKHPKATGKGYNPYTVHELEPVKVPDYGDIKVPVHGVESDHGVKPDQRVKDGSDPADYVVD